MQWGDARHPSLQGSPPKFRRTLGQPRMQRCPLKKHKFFQAFVLGRASPSAKQLSKRNLSTQLFGTGLVGPKPLYKHNTKFTSRVDRHCQPPRSLYDNQLDKWTDHATYQHLRFKICNLSLELVVLHSQLLGVRFRGARPIRGSRPTNRSQTHPGGPTIINVQCGV